MATIKSYTDLEQSKVLSKILPLESADNYYSWHDERYYVVNKDCPYPYSLKEKIPCWSLAALLEQLKPEIRLENKQILFLHINKYDDTDYEIRYTNSWTGEVFITEADNLIDVCVEMIVKLHGLNLL